MKLNLLAEAPLGDHGKQMIDQIISQLQAVRDAPDLADHYDHNNNLQKTVYNTDVLFRQIRTLDASNAKNRVQMFIKQFQAQYPQLEEFFPFHTRSEPTVTYPNLITQNLTRANVARLGDPIHQKLFLQSVEANLPAFQKAITTLANLDKHLDKKSNYQPSGIRAEYMINSSIVRIVSLEYAGKLYDFKGRGKNPIVEVESQFVVDLSAGDGAAIQFVDATWSEIVSASIKVNLVHRACNALQDGVRPEVSRIGDNDLAFVVNLKGLKPIQFTSNDFRTAQDVYKLLVAKLQQEKRPQAV